MSWVIRITGPGPTDNEVELDAIAAQPWASVDGVREWDSRRGAAEALVQYREIKRQEAEWLKAQLPLPLGGDE